VLTAGFERDVAVDGGTVSVRVEGRYSGKQFFDPFNYADLEQDAYTLINAFINYSRNSWKVGLYSRNLADKAYLNYAANVAAGGATTTDYAFGTPRTFGVRAEMTMH